MERINVFKGKAGLAKFFVIFGIIFTLAAVVLVIYYVISGFNFRFPSGDWSSVFFVFQGILFIIIGYANLNRRKYFIEWDENEMRFFLPGTRIVDIVKIDEIKSVKIKLFEIELDIKSGPKKISLENLEFEDIKKIKEKLEKIHTII